LSTWRWMFLGEAAPTILFGLFACFYFPNKPDEARWLDGEEKAWLAGNAANRAETARRNDWSILRKPVMWASALLWFCLLSGAYGIMFWLPQMVKQMTGLSPFSIGLVNALPWAGSAIGIYVNATHSDRTGERFWHIAVPAAVTAVAILLAANAGPGALGLFFLLVAGVGLGAAQGAFWALPTAMLTPATFAVGAVAINIAGSSGGIVVPYLVGLVRERTGGVDGPTWLVAAILLIAAGLVVAMRAVDDRRVAVAR